MKQNEWTSGLIYICIILAVLAGIADGQCDSPVLWYTFSEGGGNKAIDTSGNEYHGDIHGAEYMQIGKEYVLRFDGEDDYVSSVSTSKLGLSDAFTIESWIYLDRVPNTFRDIIFGSSDESLTLFPYANGYFVFPAYHNKRSNLAAKAPLIIGMWCHLVGVFDGKASRLYLDGKPTGITVFDPADTKLLGSGQCFIAGAGDGRGHLKGMIGEIRVYNHALSSKQVKSHYLQSKAKYGVNLRCYPYYFDKKIVVECDSIDSAGNLYAELHRTLKKDSLVLQTNLNPSDDKDFFCGIFIVDDLAPGSYEIRIFNQIDNNIADVLSTRKLIWPEQPAWENQTAQIKVLNSFVTELLNVKPVEQASYRFQNPRNGWIFVRSTAKTAKRNELKLFLEPLEPKTVFIKHTPGSEDSQERFKFLPKGQYNLRIDNQGKGNIRELIIRAIPELPFSAYSELPGSRPGRPDVGLTAISKATNHPYYDWAFLEKHVFPNMTTMIVRSGTPTPFINHEKIIALKQTKGIDVLNVAGLPRQRGLAEDAKSVYNYWGKDRAYTETIFDGLSVDEFGPVVPGYWQAVERIHSEPQNADKRFFGYFYHMGYYEPMKVEFARKLLEWNDTIAVENYVCEIMPRHLHSHLDAFLKDNLRAWELPVPGITKNLIKALYLYTSPEDNFALVPEVGHKVLLDEQFYHMANDPYFFGMKGIMGFLSLKADEEVLRWYYALVRHYCIEGKTNPLSGRYGYKYVLSYLNNPGFYDGLTGWDIQAAEKDSVKTEIIPGYENLAGVRMEYFGDIVLRMNRNLKKPNKLSQEITGLIPNRCYALQINVGDYNDLVNGNSRKPQNTLSVSIDNVELIPSKCFIYSYCSDKNLITYNINGKENPYWFTRYLWIFRAKEPSAKLVISDWENQIKPNDNTNQELIINFVELRTYYE